MEKFKLFIDQFWDNEIIPEMKKYIKIPNKSPVFDPEWEINGYMDDVITLVTNWIEKQKLEKLKILKLND